MLWRRSAQRSTPRPASPVPEGESVRLAALQAAWRRDRRVAQRRIWWRWTLWGAQRYGVPAMGVLGVAVGLWFAVQATMAWLRSPSPVAPHVTIGQPVPAPVAPPPAPMPSAGTTPEPIQPEAQPTELVEARGPVLKLESSLHVPTRGETPVSSAALPEAAKIPNPQLLSENWLHSKEP